jgi:chorismate mutase-like protein
MRDLTSIRSDIDHIDDQIVDLLAQRFAMCRDVADYKLKHGIPVVLPERIAQVKSRCATRAEGKGVDPAFVAALYTLIIDRTCEAERAAQAELQDA